LLIRLFGFGYSELLKYLSFMFHFRLLKGLQNYSEITIGPLPQTIALKRLFPQEICTLNKTIESMAIAVSL